MFLQRSKVSLLRHHVLTKETVVYRLGLLFKQVIKCFSEWCVFNLLRCRDAYMWIRAPLLIETWALIIVAIVVRFGCLSLVPLVVSFGMLFTFGIVRHLKHIDQFFFMHTLLGTIQSLFLLPWGRWVLNAYWFYWTAFNRVDFRIGLDSASWGLVTLWVNDFFRYDLIFSAYFTLSTRFELKTSLIKILALVSILRCRNLLVMHYHVALLMTHAVSSFELVLCHRQDFLWTLLCRHCVSFIEYFHHVKSINSDLVVHRKRSFCGWHEHDFAHFFLRVATSQQSLRYIFLC